MLSFFFVFTSYYYYGELILENISVNIRRLYQNPVLYFIWPFFYPPVKEKPLRLGINHCVLTRFVISSSAKIKAFPLAEEIGVRSIFLEQTTQNTCGR